MKMICGFWGSLTKREVFGLRLEINELRVFCDFDFRKIWGRKYVKCALFGVQQTCKT